MARAIGLRIHGPRQDTVHVNIVLLQLIREDFPKLANRPFRHGVGSDAGASTTQDRPARDGHDPAEVLADHDRDDEAQTGDERPQVQFSM